MPALAHLWISMSQFDSGGFRWHRVAAHTVGMADWKMSDSAPAYALLILLGIAALAALVAAVVL